MVKKTQAEKLTDEVYNIHDKTMFINKNLIDGEIIEYFQKFQKQTGKYSDLDIASVEFEDKKIDNLVNSKSGSSKYNKNYYQNENNKGDYPLLTGSLEIVEYINPIDESDIIKDESISYNKDNDGGSKAFYHNVPYIVGGHHYALIPKNKDELNVKYFYYFMTDFFNRNKFYQSKKPVANIGIIKEVFVKLPKSTKNYTSYEIQKAIVEFLEFNRDKSEFFREKNRKIEKYVSDVESCLLPYIFNSVDDKFLKEMFIKWNTNPSVPRKKEDMVDFTLEDIEFEEKTLKEIAIKIQAGGTPSTKKNEYWKEKNTILGFPWLDIDKNDFKKLKITKYREKITKKGYQNCSTWLVPKNSIMITIGGSLGFVAYNDFRTCTNQNILSVILKEKYYYKYIVYFLENFYKNNIRNVGNKYGNLSKSSESKRIIKIPKPITTKTKTYSSLEVQKAIVSFIDRFFEWKNRLMPMIKESYRLIDQMDELFLYKTFKDSNDE